MFLQLESEIRSINIQYSPLCQAATFPQKLVHVCHCTQLLWLPFPIWRRQQIKRGRPQPKPSKVHFHVFCVLNSNESSSPASLLKAPPSSYSYQGAPPRSGFNYEAPIIQGLPYKVPSKAPLPRSPPRPPFQVPSKVPSQRTGLMLRGSPSRFSKDEVESSSPPVFTWKNHLVMFQKSRLIRWAETEH